MGIGALNYQGVKGGIKLNDVIEEFKYAYKGQEIKAGDFVNYINGVAGQNTETSVDTQLNSMENSGYTISAVQLDENRVFIAHSRGADYYLYGMVVTINGTTITAGTDTQLSSTKNTGSQISTQLLPNGNVFIAHSYNTIRYLYGMVVTINGTSITEGTDTQLSTQSSTGETISTQLLSNGNIFIAHSYNVSYYLYGMVVIINGTSITKGTDTSLSSDKQTSSKFSTQLLPNGSIFIAFDKNTYDSNLLYGTIVTINGTSITKGTSTQLVETINVGRVISTQLLPNGNVFIAHSYGTIFQLYGMVVTINGTSITEGTDTALSLVNYTGYTISTQILSNGNIFIAHRDSIDNAYLYGMVVTINGTTITHGTDTQLSTTTNTGGRISTQLLPNGTIFIAHSYSTASYLYAQIFGIDEVNNIPTNQIIQAEYEQQVTPSTQPPFDGIALSSGVGGDDTGHNEQVKIARPNI